jgi:GTP-binding protein HflX
MASSRKAILITYPVEQAINEAISLADAAGYSIIKIVTQRQITKSKFGIGRGKKLSSQLSYTIWQVCVKWR